MVNINSTVSKLTKNVDKIGMFLGATAYSLDNLIANLMALPTSGHAPDISATLSSFLNLPEFNSGLMAVLVGWGAKEMGYGKYGKPIMKFGEGYLKGLAAQHLLFMATHKGSGSSDPQTPYNHATVTNPTAYNKAVGYGYQ